MKDIILLAATFACFGLCYIVVWKAGDFFDRNFQSDCFDSQRHDTIDEKQEEK